MPKLTKRLVDAMTPSPLGEVFLWDAELKGFGVRMMPSGVASYILKYRNREGRQRKLAIGRVGALTTEEARTLARQKLAEVAHGADPSAERQQIRQAITIAELCDLYVTEAEGRVKASTLAMDKSRIERHVKPLIGKRTVISLTPADVAKLQSDIIAGKTATERGEGRGGVTTGGKGVASRTVGMLGTILEFARKRKVVKENVARGVERPPEGKQRRFLKPAEMKALGAAMREAANDGENEVAHAAIRFLLLSGCRRMEVLSLPVDWLDPEGGCIRFGDTKSGAQIRPIGASAFAAIADTPRRNGWVFPAARGKGHFVGLPKVLARLCEKAKLEDVTVHVLRHSFAATAAEMGYSELTIAGLLGHSVSGVTARYAHVPDNALVSAANRVSARIAAALNGDTGKAKVVQMARARR
ncbi:tyrosine-type recombinase/integrase [Sphingosinicella xenopeptidilytica]|uniref:Tyrosine-type recombinase/integrase n=1 Tax=Sphingosinicella xenopeptidilytica TaxID=364098 RepID=A0ABW3BZ07_SPHXN